ncbi:MAG: hypothetical protein IAE85_06050 [Anaerolinea sp.]|nr:hypothetical protein [Anaerolinea sp.]
MKELKGESRAQAFEALQQRVAALELIMETLLPMLIPGAQHAQDILATLREWDEEPPPEMTQNEAFHIAVQTLRDVLPDE